ncbi:MAG: MATE family efflux transporter [Nitrincola lacisaponensis]|uniref:MATE family efflux transporter n=1 Tax=Nitrincola lacisaponensis TaxID=267850 RepID=UPI00391C4EAC
MRKTLPACLTGKGAEIRQLMLLAWPIMIAQMAQNSMGFVDTLMSGRAGSEDLAAIALGTSLWIPVYLAFSGILMAVTPTIAHLVGGRKDTETPGIFQQGVWLGLLLGLLAFWLLRNTDPLLSRLSLEASLQDKTQRYLAAIAWGFPALMLYQTIRGFSEGFGKTRAIMKIALLALLCNIPLNYIFIFGKLGLPAMGGVGCGWASAIVMWIMLSVGILYTRFSTQFAPLPLWRPWHRPQVTSLLQLLRLGIPIGIALLIEASMFSVIALLLAPFGEVTLAAHQITISYTGMVFMIPLSIAMALTIRVGQLQGAGQSHQARTAAMTGIGFTLLIALVTTLLTILLAPQIARLYIDDAEIGRLAILLLMIAALFQFSDALQVSAAGALRGYKDTFIPLLLVFFAFWLVGLPAGYLLGLTDLLRPAMGAAGFWYGLVIGLSVGAVILMIRLNRVSRNAQIPPTAAPDPSA